MGMESRYIWMDGRLVEFANATVHFLNVGLHYGMAVFEGIRCYSTDRDNVDGARPHLGIAVWAWGVYLGEAAIEAGIRVNILSYTRLHINAM